MCNSSDNLNGLVPEESSMKKQQERMSLAEVLVALCIFALLVWVTVSPKSAFALTPENPTLESGLLGEWALVFDDLCAVGRDGSTRWMETVTIPITITKQNSSATWSGNAYSPESWVDMYQYTGGYTQIQSSFGVFSLETGRGIVQTDGKLFFSPDGNSAWGTTTATLFTTTGARTIYSGRLFLYRNGKGLHE
jgi:hypothetical protein